MYDFVWYIALQNHEVLYLRGKLVGFSYYILYIIFMGMSREKLPIEAKKETAFIPQMNQGVFCRVFYNNQIQSVKRG